MKKTEEKAVNDGSYRTPRIRNWRFHSAENARSMFLEFLINPLRIDIKFSQPAVLEGEIGDKRISIVVAEIKKIGALSLAMIRKETGKKVPDLYLVTATSGNVYHLIAS